MTWFRVKEDSELMERVHKLEDAIDDLGLRFSFDREVILLIDTKSNKTYEFFNLETDVEDFLTAGRHIYSFPPDLEYKLCREEEE